MARRTQARSRAPVYAGLVIFLLLSVCGVIFYTLRLAQFQISEITVLGAKLVDSEAVSIVAREHFEGSYFLIVPKRTTFFAPTTELEKLLMQDPRIAAVKTSLSGTILEIQITERVEYAHWCNELCYSLDRNGFIFRTATPEVRRKYIGVLAEPIGSVVPDFISIDLFIERIETATKLSIATVTISEPDVIASFASGGELRLNRSIPEATLLADVGAIFSSPKFNRETLEYVDLRFPGRAVAKFKSP